MSAVLLAGCGVANADSWLVSPSIGLQETLTDNVNLTTSDLAQGDLVTQLTPSVTFTGKSAHANVNGTVSVPILYFARTASENNKAYPIADILGSVEAIDKFFIVEGAVSVTQPYLTPFGAQPGNLTTSTQNRYTASTYRISPYIQGTMPDKVTYELRNNSYWNNLNGAPITTSNSYTSEWLGKIESPAAPLGWAGSFDLIDVKFNNQGPQRSDLARVGPRFNYDPQLRFTADVGYEDNRYPLADYVGAIYGVGLEWRPTERTHVVANWEHRFFGSSYLFTFDHRTPLSVWNVAASRNITTYAQQLGQLTAGTSVQGLLDQLLLSQYPDPTLRQEAINKLIQSQGLPSVLSSPVNLYTEQIQLTDSASGTVGLLGVRNSIFLTLFYLRTEPITGSGGTIPVVSSADNNVQTGANFTWTYKLAPLVALNLSATALHTTGNGPDDATTSQGYATLGLSASVAPHTSVSAGVRYQTYRSNIQPDYKEKAVFGGVTYTFK